MRHPFSKRLPASLVLAWFLAFLGVAGIAPWVNAAPSDVICTTGGAAPAPDHGDGADSGLHTVKCALCLGISGPPAAPPAAAVATRPRPHVLLPFVSAHLASLVGAPLPARGPPALS